MGQHFSYDEVFPLIARVITERSRITADYVSHDEITTELVRDPGAAAILARIAPPGDSNDDTRLRASNMVAWFSQQITVGRSAWEPCFERTRRQGTYAYRPITATPGVLGFDPEVQAIEGEPRLVSHFRRERDRSLVEQKKAAVLNESGRLRCEACGFDFREAYPAIGIDFAEVHHNQPLSDVLTETVTRLEDLSLLCANCHRMIHRTQPLNSVAEFRMHLGPAV